MSQLYVTSCVTKSLIGTQLWEWWNMYKTFVIWLVLKWAVNNWKGCVSLVRLHHSTFYCLNPFYQLGDDISLVLIKIPSFNTRGSEIHFRPYKVHQTKVHIFAVVDNAVININILQERQWKHNLFPVAKYIFYIQLLLIYSCFCGMCYSVV